MTRSTYPGFAALTGMIVALVIHSGSALAQGASDYPAIVAPAPATALNCWRGASGPMAWSMHRIPPR
jgi:hypothetical protein